MSSGIFSGTTLDEALSQACCELHARVGELHYEHVDGESGGVSIQAELDPVAVVGLFLSEAFRAGKLDVRVHLDKEGEVLQGELSGSDLRLFTGGGGRGLDALQYLCNRLLTRRMSDAPPVHLDGGGFKERRARQLQEKALAAADEVMRRHAPVYLGPFSPAARREVHLALAEMDGVETESDGDGFLKRVVVRPRRG